MKKLQNKDLGGEFTDYPNEKYRQFFEKFKEIETIDISLWRPLHLLSYFCKKYKETYQLDYKFKFNSPSPSKCFEIFQIKKLAQMLSANPKILHDYIDWAYKEKAQNGKRRLTSISFITQEPTVNYYKLNILLAENQKLSIDRSSLLPDDIKVIFNTCGAFNTYGDVAFLYHAIQSGGIEQSLVDKFNVAIEKASEANFNKDVLKRIL